MVLFLKILNNSSIHLIRKILEDGMTTLNGRHTPEHIITGNPSMRSRPDACSQNDNDFKKP